MFDILTIDAPSTCATRLMPLVAEVVRCHISGTPDRRPQSLFDVHADLRQLADEFETVELRLKDRIIAVQTAPITLKDVELGPFSIELHLERLRRRNSSCFVCLALEPNPAGSNSSVVHPHVSDKALCAGDATLPLSAALMECRIADAFCLVNAVLHEYNPGSAYVALDEWEGTRCEDCDALTPFDDLNSCQGRSRQSCSDCTHTCAGCDETYCNNCLEQDMEVEEHFCRKCRRRCENCNRIVGLKHWDEETGLCRDCLEEEEVVPDDLPEEPNEQTEQQAATSPVAASG
jgi:hypothetical protein